MKNHVLRPLWVALLVIALTLVARHLTVPDDFGVQGESFTYNYHRLSNVDEWQDFKVKYKGSEYCQECHEENAADNSSSKHRIIQCENCHGPAIDHPDEPEALSIDTSRDLCLRCHTYLAYPGSQRERIKGIDPEEHNAGDDCIDCHNPHKPDLEEGS